MHESIQNVQIGIDDCSVPTRDSLRKSLSSVFKSVRVHRESLMFGCRTTGDPWTLTNTFGVHHKSQHNSFTVLLLRYHISSMISSDLR